MPFIKVYLHLVWSTKNRIPHLDSLNLRERVCQHIIENAKDKNIFIDHINGHQEHCHCLVALGSDQTI